MTESHPVPDFWAERPAVRPEPAAQPDSTAGPDPAARPETAGRTEPAAEPDSTAGLDPAARPGSLPRPDLPAVAKRSPAPGIAAQNTRLRNPSPTPSVLGRFPPRKP